MPATSTETPAKTPLILPMLVILVLLFGALGITAILWPGALEQLLGGLEGSYSDMLEQRFAGGTAHPVLLIAFAFVGGVLGSISPCILAMLPMNLAYIGTLKVESRADAARKAAAFVSGVVLVTSLFGLFSGFASAVLVQYKGYFFGIVGLFVLLMAATMLEWIRIPLPQGVSRVPSAGPFVVGTAFALISSPCASPVLFGVLALAATSGSLGLSVLTMAAYGLGYTTLIFLASLFTGLSKRLNVLKYHGTLITRLSGSILLMGGLWSVYEGGKWFMV